MGDRSSPATARRADDTREEAELDEPRIIVPGDRVGPFVVGRVLGRGGHGIVHEAHDPRLRRRVALKLVAPLGGARGRERLVREARALACIDHPNVVKVFDVGIDGEHVYLAMELIDGCDLRQWLALEQPSASERIRVIEAAGRGLEAAHRVDIVHRDFKPGNVMVAGNGRVVVTDFGLALPATPTGESPTRDRIAGTPGYIAPEQLRGEGVDARSDQYAFCCVLYEALAGHLPVRASDTRELLAIVSAGARQPTHLPATIPRELGPVLRRGL